MMGAGPAHRHPCFVGFVGKRCASGGGGASSSPPPFPGIPGFSGALPITFLSREGGSDHRHNPGPKSQGQVSPSRRNEGQIGVETGFVGQGRGKRPFICCKLLANIVLVAIGRQSSGPSSTPGN